MIQDFNICGKAQENKLSTLNALHKLAHLQIPNNLETCKHLI
jgi:hypothetical protein